MKKTKQKPRTKPEEKAFRRSDGYKFAGKQLEPFSFLRQSALSALLGVMGTSPLVELAAGLWLMSADDKTAKEARRNPEAFTKEVDKFADQHGITMTGAGLVEATEVYEKICEDLRNSTGVPQIEKPNSEEDDDPN